MSKDDFKILGNKKEFIENAKKSGMPVEMVMLSLALMDMEPKRQLELFTSGLVSFAYNFVAKEKRTAFINGFAQDLLKKIESCAETVAKIEAEAETEIPEQDREAMQDKALEEMETKGSC